MTTKTEGYIDLTGLTEAIAVIDGVLGSPGSWCNFSFEPLEDRDLPEDSALFRLLGARGPANPLATVMAAQPGKYPRPVEVGIQHGAGTKAAAQLYQAGLYLSEGASIAQDHPRRGLVVRWPQNITSETLAAWLFPAMRTLGRVSTADLVHFERTTPD